MKEVRMPDISIGRILREPLFHFFLLGLGIFAIYGSLTPNGQNDGDGTQIVIDTQDVDRLVQQFEATWRRPPTPDWRRSASGFRRTKSTAGCVTLERRFCTALTRSDIP